MTTQLRSTSKQTGRLSVAAIVGAAVLVGGGATAGADDSCGATQLSFDGVRLMNRGVDYSAGPFSVELEPGTYDITMRSWDAHDEHYQPEQENEQWYFTLDSGYTSAPANDIPTDQNTSSTHLSAQEIDVSTSVTLHHVRSGGVNSVDPICLGFTPVASADDEAAVVEETAPDPVEAEVKGIVEFAGPTSQLAPPASVVNRPPAVQAEVTEVKAEVKTEVKGIVEFAGPAPQLAITGPSSTALSGALGLMLVSIGLACNWVSSKTQRRNTELV